MKISTYVIDKSINFTSINLAEQEKEKSDELIFKIREEKDKDKLKSELLDVFDKHIKKEAEIKSKGTYYLEDVLQKMYLNFFEALENVKDITTEKLVEILNKTKPETITEIDSSKDKMEIPALINYAKITPDYKEYKTKGPIKLIPKTYNNNSNVDSGKNVRILTYAKKSIPQDRINNITWSCPSNSSILSGDLDNFDNFKKYYEKIYSLDFLGKHVPGISKAAINLYTKFCDANVPFAESSKIIKIICEDQNSKEFDIGEDLITNLITLQKSGKLDTQILQTLKKFPLSDSKISEVLCEIVRLKDENKLTNEDFENSYTLPSMLLNYKEQNTANYQIFDNYKDILNFYIKNKNTLCSNSNNKSQILTTDKFIDLFKFSTTIENNKLNISDLEICTDLVLKSMIKPKDLYQIIKNNGDKFINFIKKIDVENYKNTFKIISNILTFSYDSSGTEILRNDLSERELNFILNVQELFCSVADKIGGKFVNDYFIDKLNKDIPNEVLDRIEFYIESDIEQIRQNKLGCINLYHYADLIELYANNPTKIEQIEKILFDLDNRFYKDNTVYLVDCLSKDKNILNKQLQFLDEIHTHIDAILDNYYYYKNFIRNILQDSSDEEDLDVKIELLKKLSPKINKSKLQRFVYSYSQQDYLSDVFMLVNSVNKANKDLIFENLNNKAINKQYLATVAEYVTEVNNKFIEDLVRNNNIKNNNILLPLAKSTYKDAFKTGFMKEHFDYISCDHCVVAQNVKPANQKLLSRLYKDKSLNFPENEIIQIAQNVNDTNSGLIYRLCTDAELKFLPNSIKKIARNINSQNIELATKLCTDKTLECPQEQIADILATTTLINKNLKDLTLKQKLRVYNTINNIPGNLLGLLNEYNNTDMSTKIIELKCQIGQRMDSINLSKEQQQLFTKNILANNNKEANEILTKFDFGQYGKKGLPLKYARTEFVDNIENLLRKLNKAEQQIVLEHFGLVKGIDGFDGLPTNKPFNNKDVSGNVKDIADKIRDEIELFTLKNYIYTGEPKVDEVLNCLIKGLPEFTFIIGKKQHDTHNYSVDIHTLKVLQSAMNNPLYKDISDQDKIILKFAALLHDFGKKGAIIHKGHASLSAEYARSILEKFPFPQSIKDRIIDIVDNHHWFEAYNKGKSSAQDVAVRCRRAEDFMIYEILAKADFENVNKDFHISHSEGVSNQREFDKFFQEKMKAIDEALNLMYSKSNLVFDTKFAQNGTKFPRKEVNIRGKYKELKVLNLNELKNNKNIQEYGFSKNVTKGNASFIVHMTNPDSNTMETVMTLTQNVLHQSVWSTSLVKALDNKTYCNKKFGFIFDVDLSNISEVNFTNIGSGLTKNIETYKRIILSSDNKARTFVRDNLIKELSIKGIEITESEYIQLVSLLISKKYVTQIKKDIKIGDKIIKVKDLVECIEKSINKLFAGNDIHNELVVINPRVNGLIAKVNDIEDCPVEFLEFAHKYDLPIILMKEEVKKFHIGELL